MKHLQKSLQVLATVFKVELAWRTDMVLTIVLLFLPLLINLLIFSQFYQTTPSIGGLSLSQFISFTLVVLVIRSITTTYFEETYCPEILNGRCDLQFVRPFSFVWLILLRSFAITALRIAVATPVLLLLTHLLSRSFHFSPLPVTPIQIAQILIMMCFTYILEASISFMIVSVSFWSSGAVSLQHFKWFIIAVFGGAWLPWSFMPAWLQQASDVLPFKYTYILPVRVLLEQHQLELSDYLSMAVFGLALILLSRFIWQTGIKHYASGGG